MIYNRVGSLLALVCAGECWAWGVLRSVGVDEGDLLRGVGGGGKCLCLDGSVPETGAEGLEIVAVVGPGFFEGALELERAGGDADDIAVEVYHGAVGEAVDLDAAVAVKLGLLAFHGFEVDAALCAGASAERET